MKKIIFLLLFCYTAFLAKAQPAVEKIELKGTTYTVTKKIPEDLKFITGLYTYEWGKETEEPIVQLNEDGTGLFQQHQVAAIPIKFWLDCDKQGNIRKQQGYNGRYQVTLLIQYGNSPNGNYPTNGYDLMGVMVVPDENYIVIYGERYKKIK
jgi:hypothetical protein